MSKLGSSRPAAAVDAACGQQFSKRPLPLLLGVMLQGGVGVSVPTPLLPVPLAQSEFTRDRPGVPRIATGWPPAWPDPCAPAAVPGSLRSSAACASVHVLTVAVPELSELVDVGDVAASGDRAGDTTD